MNATVKKSVKATTAKDVAPKTSVSEASEKPAKKTTGAAASKRSAAAAETAVPVNIQSSEHLRSDNVVAGLQDRIEKTVSVKVTEVATKTPKSPSVVNTDGTLLSEAQILKMGEKDYMSTSQLAFFKARLQQLERDLLKNAGETTEHLRETVLVPDPADRATIEEEHALELRTRDRERKLLKKVQQSIASIDTGDYGWCEETGEPIGIPRLLARPTATLSLEAQQRRELKQKLYGD